MGPTYASAPHKADQFAARLPLQSSAQSYDDINSQPYSPISPTRRYRNSPLFASPATGQRGGGIDMDSMDMDSATSGWEEFGGLHNLDSGGSPYSQFKVRAAAC